MRFGKKEFYCIFYEKASTTILRQFKSAKVTMCPLQIGVLKFFPNRIEVSSSPIPGIGRRRKLNTKFHPSGASSPKFAGRCFAFAPLGICFTRCCGEWRPGCAALRIGMRRVQTRNFPESPRARLGVRGPRFSLCIDCASNSGTDFRIMPHFVRPAFLPLFRAIHVWNCFSGVSAPPPLVPSSIPRAKMCV